VKNSQDKKGKSERVIVYIDGFNLYFGMRDAGFDTCRWLNVRELIDSFLLPHQTMIEVKYFTSRVSNNPDKQKRQCTYLEAIDTTDVKIIYGHYQDGEQECKRCGHVWRTAKEKMTDVNIATALLVDAYNDDYDTAILVSGDSDLVPPIRAVHENFPTKKITVFFPPKRHNVTVAAAAKGSMIIGRKKLLDHQFPPNVQKEDGFILRRPAAWN
jgi:uncharacterized LabA/DUF88 family protein